MKITIIAQVQKGQYDYKNKIEKYVSLITDSDNAAYLPWAQICEGLVERAFDDCLERATEEQDANP